MAFAEEQAKEFRRRLLAGADAWFGVKPLKWSTVKSKKAWGLSSPTKPLVATGTYANSIMARRVPTNDRNVVRYVVGVDPNVRPLTYSRKPRTDDTTLEDIARIHEYGAPEVGIPARPHWIFFRNYVMPRAAQLRARLPQAIVAAWRPRART